MRHGASGYKDGCRCEECKAYKRRAQRSWRGGVSWEEEVKRRKARAQGEYVVVIQEDGTMPKKNHHKDFNSRGMEEQAMGPTEWAKLVGYDPVTRTYLRSDEEEEVHAPA